MSMFFIVFRKLCFLHLLINFRNLRRQLKLRTGRRLKLKGSYSLSEFVGDIVTEIVADNELGFKALPLTEFLKKEILKFILYLITTIVPMQM